MTGWLDPHNNFIPTPPYEHVDALGNRLPWIRDMLTGLQAEQNKRREEIELERTQDPNDDGYGWHIFECHCSENAAALRQEITLKLYDAGWVRCVRGRKGWCLEGLDGAIRRARAHFGIQVQDEVPDIPLPGGLKDAEIGYGIGIGKKLSALTRDELYEVSRCGARPTWRKSAAQWLALKQGLRKAELRFSVS